VLWLLPALDRSFRSESFLWNMSVTWILWISGGFKVEKDNISDRFSWLSYKQYLIRSFSIGLSNTSSTASDILWY
jgi:hypothetical protein